MEDPAYPALLSYVQRVSYLMSMGRPTASVALYLPSSSMWMGDAAADVAFVSTERMLSERQIDFDIVNDDALAIDLVAGRGTLATASGNRYGTVILPNISVLSQAALDRLRAVANGGGRVLFLGHTPSLISGRTFLDARAARPADFSWASVVSGELSPTPTPPAQPPAAPPTPQIVPEAIANAVSKAVLAPDVRLESPSTALRYTRRQLKDADVYLFFNESPEEFARRITMRSAGRRVERWDPQSGTIAPVAATGRYGTMTVALSLKPYETTVLVVR
jgi:hypothetical protein